MNSIITFCFLGSFSSSSCHLSHPLHDSHSHSMQTPSESPSFLSPLLSLLLSNQRIVIHPHPPSRFAHFDQFEMKKHSLSFLSFTSQPVDIRISSHRIVITSPDHYHNHAEVYPKSASPISASELLMTTTTTSTAAAAAVMHRDSEVHPLLSTRRAARERVFWP